MSQTPIWILILGLFVVYPSLAVSAQQGLLASSRFSTVRSLSVSGTSHLANQGRRLLFPFPFSRRTDPRAATVLKTEPEAEIPPELKQELFHELDGYVESKVPGALPHEPAPPSPLPSPSPLSPPVQPVPPAEAPVEPPVESPEVLETETVPTPEPETELVSTPEPSEIDAPVEMPDMKMEEPAVQVAIHDDDFEKLEKDASPEMAPATLPEPPVEPSPVVSHVPVVRIPPPLSRKERMAPPKRRHTDEKAVTTQSTKEAEETPAPLPEDNKRGRHISYSVKVVSWTLAGVCISLVVIGNFLGLYFSYIRPRYFGYSALRHR